MLQARLSHVALGTADLGSAQRFYEDNVGLREVAEATGRVRLALASGAHVLELAEGDGLDHLALEISADDQLSELEQILRDAGVDAEWADPSEDHPRALRFRDPDGHRLELHGRVERTGEGTRTDGRRPIGLHHVTLTAPNVPELAAFYTEVLGFAVSDRMGERFVWMRCNREHHTVAIVEGPSGGLDHYCYEVAGWADVQAWCDLLAARGVELSWGPGRHGPGNNVFIFFDDPDGVHVELSCEMERFWDDRVHYGDPRDWAHVPGTLNLWGPGPAWRRAIDREPAVT